MSYFVTGKMYQILHGDWPLMMKTSYARHLSVGETFVALNDLKLSENYYKLKLLSEDGNVYYIVYCKDSEKIPIWFQQIQT